MQLSDVHWGYDNPKVNPDAQGHAAQGDRGGQRARAEARLRGFHRRPHADHRRSEGAARAAARVPRAGRRAQGAEGVLLRRRARRLARPRRGLPGSDRRRRSTTPSITRACTSSCSTTPPTRRRSSARSRSSGSRPISRAASPTRRSSCSRTGRCSRCYPQWDWATRDGAAAIEAADAVSQRHGVLRPHPPRAPPPHRAYRAPRGDGGDVPAVAGRHGAAEDAAAVGCRRSPTRDSASAPCTRAPGAAPQLREMPIARERAACAPGTAARDRRGAAAGWLAAAAPARRRQRASRCAATKFEFERDGDPGAQGQAGDASC